MNNTFISGAVANTGTSLDGTRLYHSTEDIYDKTLKLLNIDYDENCGEKCTATKDECNIETYDKVKECNVFIMDITAMFGNYALHLINDKNCSKSEVMKLYKAAFLYGVFYFNYTFRQNEV